MSLLIFFYSNHLPEETMPSVATGPMWTRDMWSRAWNNTQPKISQIAEDQQNHGHKNKYF